MNSDTKRNRSPEERWDEEGRYTDRYIAFIDILGFANLIERSQTDQSIPVQLLRALELGISASPLHGPPSYPSGLSYAEHMVTNFSDSIVVSAEGTPHGLMTVLEISRAFACLLLQYGLLTRGGVAGGQLLHHDKVIFGPAMVSAYRLESQAAKVARIILSDDCAALCQSETEMRTTFGGYFSERVRYDTDGLAYLHLLHELELDASQPTNSGFYESWWGTARATIESYLAASRGQPYYGKVVWFSDYYDACLADGASDGAVAFSRWRVPLRAVRV